MDIKSQSMEVPRDCFVHSTCNQGSQMCNEKGFILIGQKLFDLLSSELKRNSCFSQALVDAYERKIFINEVVTRF